MENKDMTLLVARHIIDELLDSSSSSDDEETIAILQPERKVHCRVNNFVENVIHVYSDAEFKNNFRVSRQSVTYLMERFESVVIERSYQGGRPQTNVEKQLLAFLWFCGNKTTIREVANLFDMSRSCTHRSISNVLEFMTNVIAPEVIKFPRTPEEKDTIATEFGKVSGIPYVLGCIDGSYISVRTPKHKIRSTYANRHDTISITMQGICDAKLRFLDVFTGVPSKIHDSRVLKLSFISKELANICGNKYYLLGDSAYPLREYLLIPYRDYGNLTESEKLYNLKFCQTRVKIENAFGVLKSRFRQLMRLDFHNVDKMAKFILACCALHNICIDRCDLYDENVPEIPVETSDEYSDENQRDILLSQLGHIRRNDLKDYLFNSNF